MTKSTTLLIECDHESRTAKLTFGPFEGGKMFSREWKDADFSMLKDLEDVLDDSGDLVGRRLASDILTIKLTGRSNADVPVVRWTVSE